MVTKNLARIISCVSLCTMSLTIPSIGVKGLVYEKQEITLSDEEVGVLSLKSGLPRNSLNWKNRK